MSASSITKTYSTDSPEWLLKHLHQNGFPTCTQIVKTGDNTTVFYFSSTLTAGQQLDLTNAINSFVPPKKFKIYQYVPNIDPYSSPAGIDYKTGLTTNLIPARVMVNGELRQVIYYAVYDISEPVEINRYKEPVLKVSIVYYRDDLGFAQYRTVTRQWYLEDGTLCTDPEFTKTTFKVYDFLSTIEEGRRRRRNIISGMLIPCLGMIIQTELANPTSPFKTREEVILEARRFLAANKPAIIDFIDDSHTKFYNDMLVDTTPWLNNVIDIHGTTIRQYILANIDIQDVK